MSAHRTLHRVEVRPLSGQEYRTVRVYSPILSRYVAYALGRGKWHTVYWRIKDGRAVFSPDLTGARRLLGPGEAKKVVTQFKTLGFATRVHDVEVRRWKRLTGDLDFRAELGDKLDAVALELGITIHVISGARTLAEQEILYDLYKRGLGNLAAKPNANAPHIRGIAADAYVNGVALRNVRGAAAACERHGLHFPVSIEAWHVELRG